MVKISLSNKILLIVFCDFLSTGWLTGLEKLEKLEKQPFLKKGLEKLEKGIFLLIPGWKNWKKFFAV